MPDDRKESSEFKVVDRRLFSEDGKRREEAGEEHQTAPSSAPPQATSAKPAAAPSRPSAARPESAAPEAAGEEFAGEYAETGPAGFDTLVSYLSTTAMFQLGFLPGPGGERIPVDLVNARRTIDLLEVLQEKTDGNLTDDEARMLDEVLYELRMSFVEVQKRFTQKKK